MSEKKADKQAPEEGRNPLLPKISINKWEPDKKMMDSIDEGMIRATGGQEPDQWHKDYTYA